MSLHCECEDHVVGGAQGEGLQEFENLAENQTSYPSSVEDLPDKLTWDKREFSFLFPICLTNLVDKSTFCGTICIQGAWCKLHLHITLCNIHPRDFTPYVQYNSVNVPCYICHICCLLNMNYGFIRLLYILRLSVVKDHVAAELVQPNNQYSFVQIELDWVAH